MRKNKPNKLLFIICLIIFSLSTFGCEITFHPNFNLYETPYGTVCMQDSTYKTIYFLAVPGEELYYLKAVQKSNHLEKLIDINISDDKSKLFILIENSTINYKPYGTGLFVFDLINPQDNYYYYNCFYKHLLNKLLEVTDKDITEASILNNSITYKERSGEVTTILFDTLQPVL